MRRFVIALLLPLMLISAGCRTEQSADSNSATAPVKTPYSSDTSTEDCYLCGGGIENLIPSCWGQSNIALISSNTFEIKPLEINRYDRINGRLIEEYAGAVSFGGSGSKDGGFGASLLQNYDRGYATGHVDFYDDEVLDASKAAGFLCEGCLNKILPSQLDRYFGVGAINLVTKEIRVFEEHPRGFGLGDFYFDCDLKDRNDGKRRINLLIFYCPIRYEKEP